MPTSSSGFMPLLWFVGIIVAIPVVLWLLKRTPMGGAGTHGVMRSVGVLPISTSQRILTIEVGQGEQRRWLVLGVTPQSITTLHTMEPQAAAQDDPAQAPAVPPFAQLLARLRHDKRDPR